MPATAGFLTLESLYASLPAAGPVPVHATISSAALPASARLLLAHDEHMTEVMERFHGGKVGVQVLNSRRSGDEYSRQIILRRERDQAIVQGGLVRIRLNLLPREVVVAILKEDTPLGRLLVEHQTLRRVDIRRFLRFEPQPALEAWLGPLHGQVTFGRLGFLHVDGEPGVEVFEILAAPSLGVTLGEGPHPHPEKEREREAGGESP